jgi:hypothetical protein
MALPGAIGLKDLQLGAQAALALKHDMAAAPLSTKRCIYPRRCFGIELCQVR